MFDFGPKVVVHPGQSDQIATIGLHLQCPWRIRLGSEILVASSDLEQPRSTTPISSKTFDPNEIGTSLRDERLETLLVRDQPVVTSVEASSTGDFAIYFGDRLVLELFNDHSPEPRKARECWRLLFVNTDRPHVVMTSLGVES
jgi:hypothetical protein